MNDEKRQSPVTSRAFAATSKAALIILLAAGSVHAQGYPAKPNRYIVGFPPGGANDIVARALKSPDVRERLQGLGADPVGDTPEQYTAFMQNEIAKWDKVIKAAGIKGE